MNDQPSNGSDLDPADTIDANVGDDATIADHQEPIQADPGRDCATEVGAQVAPGRHGLGDEVATNFDEGEGEGATILGNSPSPTPSTRRVPVVPGYEILGELGRGAMGVVYEARQIRLNRRVALKMILAGEHAGPEASFPFLAEAVARLDHPNIVRIFHLDTHEGRPYFEMEYVGGGSLAGRLDGTPRPPRRDLGRRRGRGLPPGDHPPRPYTC